MVYRNYWDGMDSPLWVDIGGLYDIHKRRPRRYNRLIGTCLEHRRDPESKE